MAEGPDSSDVIKRLGANTRAVSVTVTHALTIAITLVLLTMLFISSGTLIDSNESDVTRTQLGEIGGDVASLINTLDGLGQRNGNVTTSLAPSYPRDIPSGSNERYTIAIRHGENEPQARATLYLNSSVLGSPVAFELATTTPLAESETFGNDMDLRLCIDDGQYSDVQQYISFRSCDDT